MIYSDDLSLYPEAGEGGSFPEQYDVLLNGKTVGYLRIRHGHFTVECPDVGGTLMYEAYPAGYGEFEDAERSYFLNLALSVVLDYVNGINNDD